jgi:hypothetical protein
MPDRPITTVSAFCDELHLFARRNGAIVVIRSEGLIAGRVHHFSVQLGEWTATGINRSIMVVIDLRGVTHRVAMYPSVIRYDQKALLEYSPEPSQVRGYFLWIPVEADLAMETMEMAMSDVFALTDADLTHRNAMTPR